MQMAYDLWQARARSREIAVERFGVLMDDVTRDGD